MTRFLILSTVVLGLTAQSAAAATISISCSALGTEYELCKSGAEAWAKKTGNEVQFGPVGQATAPPGAAGGGKSNDRASTAPDVAGGPYAQQPSAGGQANRDQRSAGGDAEQLQSRGPEPGPFVIGSLALLAVGLALFGLRFLARRAV